MQTQSESDHLNRKLSDNFRARDFICPCCDKEGIKDDLVFHLQLVHNLLPEHQTMIITSGYRCFLHNKIVGGADNSAHLGGWAADIKCDNSTYRFHLVAALIEVGFKRIGKYDDFIHADIDPAKHKPVIW